ncbi:hypothetical protein [Xanthobacter sediminis]
MASVASLEHRRRELAADYAKASRRHDRRAGLARKLVQATCAALKADIRRRPKAEATEDDLFSVSRGRP